MDINQLITKYGATISKDLQIASSAVYGKLIWYTQVSGIIALSQFFAWAIISLVFITSIYMCLRRDIKEDSDTRMGFIVFCFVAAASLGFLTLFVSNELIKIFIPQYWLIDQVIQKVNGN